MMIDKSFLISIFSVIFILNISSCSKMDHDFILTQDLPPAQVGKQYYAEIKTQEYRVVDTSFLISHNLTTENGLEVLEYEGTRPFAKHALTIIQGTPKQTGTFKIILSGTRQDNLKNFERTFTLNIRP